MQRGISDASVLHFTKVIKRVAAGAAVSVRGGRGSTPFIRDIPLLLGVCGFPHYARA